MPPGFCAFLSTCAREGVSPNSDILLQATVEHVSQAVLFLEDAGDLGQALNTDVDEMSMDEQVHDPAALHSVLPVYPSMCA